MAGIDSSGMKFADEYYKELVRTCGRTWLGSEARAKNWLPDIKQDGDKILTEVVPHLMKHAGSRQE
jgi:hypothetical protein